MGQTFDIYTPGEKREFQDRKEFGWKGKENAKYLTRKTFEI